jgi:hypothetical protein
LVMVKRVRKQPADRNDQGDRSGIGCAQVDYGSSVAVIGPDAVLEPCAASLIAGEGCASECRRNGGNVGSRAGGDSRGIDSENGFPGERRAGKACINGLDTPVISNSGA